MTLLPIFPSSPHPSPSPNTAFVSPDEGSVVRLIGMIVERSGMPQAEIARRMGITLQSLNQYKQGRRSNPNLRWLARLAEVCGARILVEWPR